MISDVTFYSEDTLFKVRGALIEATTSEAVADNCINEMLNAGILFRERVSAHDFDPGGRRHWIKPRCKVCRKFEDHPNHPEGR